MLKHVLLAGAVMISVPALAQTMPKDGQAKPATPSTSTTAPTTATPPAPTTPQPTEPAAPVTTTDATTPAVPVAPEPAAPTAAAPTAGAQVADVVGKEFPAYDKNSDGKLSKTEFGSWMFALRKASDASLKDDAANKKYVTGAFMTADTDKSKSVSKDELTNFLTQGQTAAAPAPAAPAAGTAHPAPAPEPAPAPQPAPSAQPATPPVDPAPTTPAAPQPDK